MLSEAPLNAMRDGPLQILGQVSRGPSLGSRERSGERGGRLVRLCFEVFVTYMGKHRGQVGEKQGLCHGRY